MGVRLASTLFASFLLTSDFSLRLTMRNGNKPVGILAIQGDFAMHAKMLDRIGAPWKLVKHASDLDGAGGLIMPGGESTTMLKFFAADGLGPAIKDLAAAGQPLFGPCAGAVSPAG